MSTHNLCFRAKIRKPQFYYIKVGRKGVFITRTCKHDDINGLRFIQKRQDGLTNCIETVYEVE